MNDNDVAGSVLAIMLMRNGGSTVVTQDDLDRLNSEGPFDLTAQKLADGSVLLTLTVQPKAGGLLQ